MQIKSRSIQFISVWELKQHPKNPHKHTDEQIDRLIHLYKNHGYRVPVIVQQGTNYVVAGEGRLKAARKSGMETIPVIYQEFESEQQLYAFMTSDNAIGKDKWASLDLEQMGQDLSELEFDLDPSILGLTDSELEDLDFDIAKPEEESKGFVPEKTDLEQMGFTLTSEQADQVRTAIEKAKAQGRFDSTNPNKKGNALARICETYVTLV